MADQIPYYPVVKEISGKQGERPAMIMQSVLRLNIEGVYYLKLVQTSSLISSERSVEIKRQELIQQLHEEVYLFLYLGVFTNEGLQADPNQMNELHRLKTYFGIPEPDSSNLSRVDLQPKEAEKVVHMNRSQRRSIKK